MNRRLALAVLIPALLAAMVAVGVLSRGGVAALADPPPRPLVEAAPSVSEAPAGQDRPAAMPAPAPEYPDAPAVVEEPARGAHEPAAPAAPAEPEVDVVAVQAALQGGRYYVGPLDGKAGLATTSAVMAFQKVQGLVVDGVVGPATLAALERPVVPTLRGGPATRIEVDLTRQVLHLVKGGERVRTLPVSSGSGATYATAGGGTERSLTPVGTFRIERRITGERHAALGVLYDPLYFHRGWAIHGSSSVPAHPASHGCVRVTRPDAVWLAGQVGDGTTVILHGGTHTFTPGSGAAGTDAPAGDAPGATP